MLQESVVCDWQQFSVLLRWYSSGQLTFSFSSSLSLFLLFSLSFAFPPFSLFFSFIFIPSFILLFYINFPSFFWWNGKYCCYFTVPGMLGTIFHCSYYLTTQPWNRAEKCFCFCLVISFCLFVFSDTKRDQQIFVFWWGIQCYWLRLELVAMLSVIQHHNLLRTFFKYIISYMCSKASFPGKWLSLNYIWSCHNFIKEWFLFGPSLFGVFTCNNHISPSFSLVISNPQLNLISWGLMSIPTPACTSMVSLTVETEEFPRSIQNFSVRITGICRGDTMYSC